MKALLLLILLLGGGCATLEAIAPAPTAEDICRAPPRDGQRARWVRLCDGINLPKPPPVDAPDFCTRPDAKALWPFWHDVVCKVGNGPPR